MAAGYGFFSNSTSTLEKMSNGFYKQTEIGMIPEDWEVKQLGEIADIDPENLTRTTHAEYEFRYISLEDVERGVLKGYVDQVFCTAPSRARRVLRDGDVLLSTVRPNLKSHLLFKKQGNNWICSTGFSVLRCKKGLSIPAFLFSHLFSGNIDSQIETLIAGSNYPAINSSDVQRLKIAVSTIKEQRDVDALIAALDKLIAKKRDLKTATMQQLLTGKKRLPGFSGEWKAKQLSDVCEIISGGTPSTSNINFWNGNVSWCTPTDITATSGKYLERTARKISEEGLRCSAANLLPVGSILLCTRATIGEMKIAKFPVATNQGFKSLISQEDTNNEFIYYLMLSHKNKLIEKGVGSTFLEISKKDVASLTFNLPSVEEQSAIATVLSDMDNAISLLESRQAKTRAIKQGMMQELLTGRTRLV